MIEGPRQDVYPTWFADRGDIHVRFLGRGPRASRAEALGRLAPPRLAIAWARQVHSARVLEARPGDCGEGDALITRERGLGLTIATADCVPVLLAGRCTLAAVHAGWRGIAGRILAAAVEATAEDPAELEAWIGPAIGGCCYEVGEEVAAEVAAASCAEVVAPGPRERPHLDLAAAVASQLEGLGVRRSSSLAACTRCDAERLWSYRREGREAGRNLALIWRDPS